MHGCIRLSARLFFLSILFASAAAANELPEDQPLVPQLIHKLEHPVADAHHAELNFSYLYGDKFLSTRGITARDTYFTSETFGITGALSMYSSSATDEVAQLAATGVTPRAYDPSFIFRVAAVYQPIYGKIIVGSHVVRFHLGIEGGFHLAQESYLNGDNLPPESRSQMALGPMAAIRLTVPVFGAFSVVARAEALLHSDIANPDGGMRRLLETSLGVGYHL